MLDLRSVTGACMALLLGAALLAGRADAATPPEMRGLRFAARFGPMGLTSVRNTAGGHEVRLASDTTRLVVDGVEIEVGTTPAASVVGGQGVRTYTWRPRGLRVQVRYQVKPGWSFVSKQVLVTPDGADPIRVSRVEPLSLSLSPAPTQVLRARSSAFLRYGADAGSPGLFVALQNPFLDLRDEPGRLALAYRPDMDWDPAWGAFESDRACIGCYTSSGRRYPAGMTPEWQYLPGGRPTSNQMIDVAEVDAMVECVRAFLLWNPRKSIRIHVGWCENDYQVDIGTADGRAEYRRIIDRAADVGCSHILFTPGNNALAPLSESRDAWGWENVLWLGLGQKIRKGEWDTASGVVPASVRELLGHAAARKVKPVAYVYPSLPFKQDPTWTSWVKGEPGGYLGADTGNRSFQDWLLTRMFEFRGSAGVGGYCFDHWWIAYDETPSSKYAQWYGCRRILEELRRKMPDAVIDGRQQYHWFGVWTWLAGSYPHPLNTDEQPASFKAFPDLHTDRVSADRQRYIAWWYRMHEFVPPEIMPGYMTHQTERNDPALGCRRDRFRPTDWDLLGWRYSVLSSIATAPFNHVVDMLPARDKVEYERFSPADRKWFRDWLDFTDRNRAILRNVHPILGQPMVGQVDGTAAFKGSEGFVFLFNPNYRALPASFRLDESIGLGQGKRFVLRRLFPDALKGTILLNNGQTTWAYGDTVNVAMPGADALALQVEPVAGNAAVAAGPQPSPVVVPRLPQVGAYDPTFAGGVYTAEATIPAEVTDQLRARKRSWPVAYTADDLLATWLGSDRLLLFVNVADPNEAMSPKLRVDGCEVPLAPAYNSVYREAPERTLVGWYADLSSLAVGAGHRFELELPRLAPGQFQGMFLDNVEEIRRD